MEQIKKNKRGGAGRGQGRHSKTGEKNDYITIVIKKSTVLKLGGKKQVKQRLESVADKLE